MEVFVALACFCLTLSCYCLLSYISRFDFRAKSIKSDFVENRRINFLQKMIESVEKRSIPAYKSVLSCLTKSRYVNKWLQAWVRFLYVKGTRCSVESLLGFLLTTGTFSVIALALIFQSAVKAVAVFALVCVALHVHKSKFEKNEQTKKNEHALIVVQTLRSCFQSGLNLEQSFSQIAALKDNVYSATFARCVKQMQMGTSTHHALETLRLENDDTLKFLFIALDIQHASGGSLSQVFVLVEDSIRCNFNLQRRLSVKTAQTKLSAQIVCVMPFLLLGVFMLISDDFLDPFFTYEAGYVLLVLAFGLLAAGIYSVRKALHIEGLTHV